MQIFSSINSNGRGHRDLDAVISPTERIFSSIAAKEGYPAHKATYQKVITLYKESWENIRSISFTLVVNPSRDIIFLYTSTDFSNESDNIA